MVAKHRKGDWLAPKNRIDVRCPICNKYTVWDVKGKDNSFSYLESTYKVKGGCDHCGTNLKLDDGYAYGWVQN